MDVSAGRVPGAYVVPLVHAMIGVLRNRFSVLWDPAMECLAALVDTLGVTAWDVVTAYLQEFQEDFLSQQVVKSRKREDAAEDSETSPPGEYAVYNSHCPSGFPGEAFYHIYPLGVAMPLSVEMFIESGYGCYDRCSRKVGLSII